jgi:hypothetical protein
MDRRKFIQLASSFVASKRLTQLHAEQALVNEKRQRGSEFIEFVNPPDSAHPWVYSFWMEGNITKEGITADLEAMKESRIAGLLFMDGALGNPPGPYRFMSESWLEMFDHMMAEANRLGIEVNLNNDPGWAGSGGPWVKPEGASQKVIVSETVLEGPLHFDDKLALPANISHDFYKDIAVLAYPAPKDGKVPSYRIPDVSSTKSFAGGHDFAGVVPWPRFIPTNPEWPAAPTDQCIQASGMQDLTDKLKESGNLGWDVPAGHWIVLRIGHTVANGGTRYAQEEANGLECNKLSKSAVSVHFSAMVEKLAERAGPLAGKVLVSTHIDSWEAGSGNWTDNFHEEFTRRRGYNLLPFMPALNGIVIDSREASERFLWDYRETVCELVLENYAEHFRNLAHDKGLRLSIEAYDGTCDDLRYAGRADEPMSEFWRSCYSGLPLSDLSESMVSAAHVYGKNIIGAEAFTSLRGDFLDHPATLKPLADWAFCTGINRLCFSEWVMQPWPRLAPGISFQAIGTVFHRSSTWWAQSKPWHEYVARCQYMLRQGQFIADICFVVPEGAPYRFTPPIAASTRGGIPDRPGYNFDGCPAELVIKEMTVQDGKILLRSGMSYRLLVLPTYEANGQPVMRLMDQDDYFYKPMQMPKVRTMTPELLLRVKELVEGGATVLGYRPLKSPSLSNFPNCDNEITHLADAIWGHNAGADGVGEHRLGKGLVVWGSTPEEILTQMGAPEDFVSDPFLKGKLNYTHRRTADGTEIYFLVNKQAGLTQGSGYFRTTGKQPHMYWPQTGRIDPVVFFEEKNGVTKIPLSLNASESVFVVFRSSTRVQGNLSSVTRNGDELWPIVAGKPAVTDTNDEFTMAAWVTPAADILLPKEVGEGWSYMRDDVQISGAGFQTYTAPGQGRAGFAFGKNGVVVFQYSEAGIVEPLLVYAAPISSSTHIGVLYKDKIPKLFVNGKLVKSGPKNPFPRYGNSQWDDKRPFAGEIAAMAQFDEMLKIDGTIQTPSATDYLPAIDFSHGTIRQSGIYKLGTANGKSRQLTVDLPPPQEITGPWEVAFDPLWGGPAKVTFDKLQDWSTRLEKGIKYYSGSALYRKSFRIAGFSSQRRGSRIILDLGEVAVMAEIILNGTNLGTVWCSPYQLDITEVVKSDNTLEIKVVNLWVNRLIGDESLRDDSDRDPNGTPKKWPKWVEEGKSSPTGRFTFTTYRQWSKDAPLVKSGLLGPVRLLTVEKLGFDSE